MEFKDLEEAKKYIAVKEQELEDTKKALEESNKSGLELKAKNDELVKTNSKLLTDIVNMGASNNKKDENKKEEDTIPPKESFFEIKEDEE